MIAPAFLGALIAIFQIALYLVAQATLQNAAIEAGRLFMTGQAQNGSTTQTQFSNDICPMISALFTCANLMVNVTEFSNFLNATATAPALTYNTNGSVSNTWSYQSGLPGQVMVVQLIYQWPIYTGPFGYILPNLGNGKTELYGVSAFRVEPY
jgi:Flp pilus assembly protein TadG